MLQEIYMIDDDNNLIEKLQNLFKEDCEYNFTSVKTEELDIVLKNIPALIIINEDTIDEDLIKVCKKIRTNEDNSITPLIVISSSIEEDHIIDVLKTSVEYYIKKPVEEEYLYYTIKNITRLLYTNRRVSPLTGLPGNVQIQAELKKRLSNKEEFAIMYLDIDNFKAYNDVYGFMQGDEIIKFTARTILRNIHSVECENPFVGHIGGDDFVAIVGKTDYDIICQNIIADFDKNVKKYFTKTDLERGYIEVANRRCIIEEFPLTSISIGVVEIDNRFKNTLEIGEAGAGVKHLAKITMGSAYVIDRRKSSKR